ncbi:MAG: nuclear transport factor 2 family protein [Cyclobacteriaceae bacterium]
MKVLIAISIIGVMLSCDGTKEPEATSSNAISMEEISIRYARDMNNKAIEERDTVAIDDVWMENIVVISSADAQIMGRDSLKGIFIDQFKSSPDVNYVRTPSKIEMMKAWGMASEIGTWEGSWTAEDGKIEISGTYYAKWHKVRSKWMIRTEVYTATQCTGGAYCNSIP